MRKPFSFANLVGGGARSRSAAEEETDASATEDEDEASETEDESEDQAEEDETTGAESEEESDQAARRAGALAERQRIAGILALATPETVAQAAVFATQTDMTVAQCRTALAAAPKPASSLSEAMRNRAGTSVGQATGGVSANALPPELQAAQARRIKKER